MDKLVKVGVQGQCGAQGPRTVMCERDACLMKSFSLDGLLSDERGQGTTEYAILVGVLVVIAILAIIAFKGKVQELWDAIVSGMNAL
jgi:Flp pilus assembly pilin Flp